MKKSIIAGSFISLGAFAYLTILNKTNNLPLASLSFYIGLFLILLTQTNLFTGKILTLKTETKLEYITQLTQIWIGNLIGSIISTIILFQIFQPNVSQIIQHKLGLNPVQMIISGIVCNLLVCSAVHSYNKYNNHIMSAFCIFLFVILGCEHIVANFSYYTLGFLEGINAQLIISLVFVTIGNIIGGLIVRDII